MLRYVSGFLYEMSVGVDGEEGEGVREGESELLGFLEFIVGICEIRLFIR